MAQDPSIHENLQGIVDRFQSARKLQQWIDLDVEFHRTLLDASGLSPLVAFSDLLQVFFQQFRDSVKKAEWELGIASHQLIVDCLQEGDVDNAVAELRDHIGSHKGRMKVQK